MATRNQERERLREERVAHQQRARQRSRRPLGAYLLAGLLSVALIAGVVAIVAGGSGGSSASAGSFAQHYSGLSARRGAAGGATNKGTKGHTSPLPSPPAGRTGRPPVDSSAAICVD